MWLSLGPLLQSCEHSIIALNDPVLLDGEGLDFSCRDGHAKPNLQNPSTCGTKQNKHLNLCLSIYLYWSVFNFSTFIPVLWHLSRKAKLIMHNFCLLFKGSQMNVWGKLHVIDGLWPLEGVPQSSLSVMCKNRLEKYHVVLPSPFRLLRCYKLANFHQRCVFSNRHCQSNIETNIHYLLELVILYLEPNNCSHWTTFLHAATWALWWRECANNSKRLRNFNVA